MTKTIKIGSNDIMRGYLAKRIVVSIFILYVIATLNFLIYQANPAFDYKHTLIKKEIFPAEVVEQIMVMYGLREPLHVRYVKYVANMFTWQFGYTFQTRRPVIMEMVPRLTNTVLLLGSAYVLEIMVGIPLGILAARRRKTKTDVGIIGSGLFARAVPAFFVYLLVLLFLSYQTYLIFGRQFFPLSGMTSIPPPADPLAYISDVAWHMTLPLLALIIKGFGSWALYTRNLMVDALSQDYVLTARAKGLKERTVLYSHAFRGILPPIATIMALRAPGIVTGAMICEFVFTWPGIGTWYLNALKTSDYPVMQSVLFMYAFLLIVANFISDLLYGVMDPRIRVGRRR